jgi:hypothetical protein
VYGRIEDLELSHHCKTKAANVTVSSGPGSEWKPNRRNS